MTVQSKFVNSVTCTCAEFQHQWTDKCINASAGLVLTASPYCLRVYTVVYLISMVMRRRIPTLDDLKKTAMGILQSSAFLTTNAFGFTMYTCLLRNIIGKFYKPTIAFIPCFLASYMAIIVERPQRRPMLTLYVANVATETLWNMAEARGWVRSIPNGQAIIFGISVSALLYLYRLGLHKTEPAKDSIFNILKMFVGKTEEGALDKESPMAGIENAERSRVPLNFTSINGIVQAYARFIEALKSKHSTCGHREACIKYAVMGGLKPFVGGVGLQVALKLLMNIKKVATNKLDYRKTFLDKNTLKLGAFLGSFSFLYKSVSCILRHSLGRDDPRFAIPAGLIGSIAFTQYPDTTVALYVMWKALQLVYKVGIEKGVLPEVPYFTMFLYSFCTAVLFHAGILEPKTLRPSYFKFLEQISGGRLSRFQMSGFDPMGYNAHEESLEVLKTMRISNNDIYPKFAMA